MGFFSNLIGKIKARYITAGKPASTTGSNIPPNTTDDRTPQGSDEWLFGGYWLTVASSNVDEIRYLYDARILEVKYLWGGVYQYYQVDEQTARQCYDTDSPGRFVWRTFRASESRFPYVFLPGVSEKKTSYAPNVIRPLTEAERRKKGI